MHEASNANLRRGVIVWFTGPPASGKKSLAALVHQALLDSGIRAELLNAEEMRDLLWPELGKSEDEEMTFLIRLGHLCHILSRNRIMVLVAAISRSEDIRRRLRSSLANYVEIFCKASLRTRIARAPGSYHEFKEQGTESLASDEALYEEPAAPDLVIHTDQQELDDSARTVLNWLNDKCYLDIDRESDPSGEELGEVKKRLHDLGYI